MRTSFAPSAGLDRAADVAQVGFLRGNVPSGDRDVLVEQLGDGDVRVRLPSCPREREQTAGLDLRLCLGPAGLPEPDLAAGQRSLPAYTLARRHPLTVTLCNRTCSRGRLHSHRLVGPRTGHKSTGEGIKPRWGGWGSNPRPADYEEAALVGVGAGREPLVFIGAGQPGSIGMPRDRLGQGGRDGCSHSVPLRGPVVGR